MVTRSARGRVDGRDSGAVAEAPGLRMVSVTTTRGGDDALRGVVPSAPLRRGDEEPMEVDAPPEAEPRPLSIARLQGRWFQRFCARVETEGATSFSLGRLGGFQHRGSNGDGFPGGLRRRLAPSVRDVLCKLAQGGRHPVPQKVPETAS